MNKMRKRGKMRKQVTIQNRVYPGNMTRAEYENQLQRQLSQQFASLLLRLFPEMTSELEETGEPIKQAA